MALQFPIKEDPLNSENPIVDIHSEDNGVTYYWDPASNSWILVTAQSVNKDYVDGRDELRYRRDGSDFIYGDVILRKESDFAVEPVVIISTRGTLMLSDENKILFSSQDDSSLPSLTYGVPGNETEVLSFDTNFLIPKKQFRYTTSDAGDRIFYVENDSAQTLTLFDIQLGGGMGYTTTQINIPNNKNDKFVISSNWSGDTDISSSGFVVKGDSTVEVFTSSDSAFVVRNSNNTKNKIPFTVQTTTHKLLASTEYSRGLVQGGGQVTTSSNNSTVYQDFSEPNLLATKEYVDSQAQVSPGFNVCADSEDEAKPGGFWRSGSNLFWKI